MTVNSPRVLVVSESRITRRVVEMTFADQPLELVMAPSGAAGLDAWQARPAAVVVVDLTMEPPDGLAVARHLADHGGGVPVIAMAGQNDAVDEVALADAGVRGVLRKPLDSMQLVDAVRAALRDGRRLAPAAAPWPVAVAPAEATSAPMEAAWDAPDAVDALEHDSGGSGQAPAPAPALTDADLERVAARVVAIWTGDQAREERVSTLVNERVDRVVPAATTAAAERLVRELAPAVVAEVARLVVADVSERLVREEIARMRAAHSAR